MGDQVGLAVSGTLHYVPLTQFERVRALAVPEVQKAEVFAALCRINILYMIARAGSGHIGSSFSSIDIMSWLQLQALRPSQDIFFSSKGHDAPALYSTYLALGKLDFSLIHELRRVNGLPGHPDVNTPHIVTNTGSLGMGVSKAKGMIFANRLREREGRVYVLTGDGELQEGQFWESLISAANHRLHELTVIVDHNKLQSDTLVSKVSDLGDLSAKFEAFGWHVSRCDGNDMAAFARTLTHAQTVRTQPQVIIADTIKGKGVSFMEHTAIDSDVEFYKFHSGAPSEDAYGKALAELVDTARGLLAACGGGALHMEPVQRPEASASAAQPQRLVQAYSEALLVQARRNPNLVALDADLILDTGLIAFQKEFPHRFVECGIAEQDMVSQAGGMALQGLLPVVHSFACFLSARPNEQIYNNATEQEKIIYVGSLAGVLPGGPGHSHQAVRDISALAAVPGLVLMEPSCEAEVAPLLDWAVNEHTGSSYLRLVSLPWPISYRLPAQYQPKLGQGVALTAGDDALIISAGPVMLESAVQAAHQLRERRNLGVKVINLPWLNHVDPTWLAQTLRGYTRVFSLDNHYTIGGQGDRIAAVLAQMAQTQGERPRLTALGLTEVPVAGTPTEVLEAHQLNAAHIARHIEASF